MDSPNIEIVLLVAFLFGLRHALDPDHLVAVSTLVAGKRDGGATAAGRLGASWGIGHAMTLIAFGLPVVFAGMFLPEIVQRAAESAIGVIIVFLAVRLLVRWRRGAFHAHPHDHDGEQHVHLHPHADDPSHGHTHRAARTPLQAFLIGMAHGTGGSAAAAVLVLASIPDIRVAAVALAVLALGAAISMATLSTLFGWLLTAPPVRRRLVAALPALGVFSMVFGLWYAAAPWG